MKLKNQKKILMVEDDLEIAESVKILFQEEGFSVTCLPDYSLVNQIIETEIPDLILVDYLLPQKNGLEIIKEVRQKDLCKNLPIIMMAANQLIKNEAKSQGANDFIEKPFDINQLLDLVTNHIAKTSH